MLNAEEIRTERDPFLREVWAIGYDFFIIDPISDSITLCRKSDRYTKSIPLFNSHSFKIIGTTHKWISEADGSADRFRELIKPLQIIDRS